ncbi:MAG: GNAT family N-acetyltransferase [Hamadaea sp.]|nr:GNAT family N-acetyltransferase [Hamadaea sp.]
MLIRDTTVDDIADLAAIRYAVEPWLVATVETQRIWFEGNPPEAQVARYCAEIDGRVLANGWAKRDLYADRPDAGVMALFVHPDVQRQGIGTDLLRRLEDHLRGIGVARVQAHIVANPATLAFAQRHGFTLGAAVRMVAADPRVLPSAPDIPPGVTVLSAGEAGPRPWYDVVDVAARDEPGDVPFTGMPYEDFLVHKWPAIDKDLSLIAFVDGRPAATTALIADYDIRKVMSGGTDALREYRGRGLVKLIKVLSLARAAERGIIAAYTGNDEVNAPMRAINAWLGYELIGESRAALKQLI